MPRRSCAHTASPRPLNEDHRREFKGRTLFSPPEKTTRPTLAILRASFFNRCQFDVPGALVLDLFAGSGAIGLEAISRGARHATFVEKEKGPFRCLQKNIDLLGVKGEATPLLLPANRAALLLVKEKKQFDLIYIDPPYDEVATEVPLLFSLLPPLLSPGGRLFLELAATAPAPFHASLVDERIFGAAKLLEYRF